MVQVKRLFSMNYVGSREHRRHLTLGGQAAHEAAHHAEAAAGHAAQHDEERLGEARHEAGDADGHLPVDATR